MTFKGELKSFQDQAKEKMLERGAFLLAHTMGLGKTVTTIAAIEELIDSGEVECCLVLCTASVKWQWMRQIEFFTDGALITVIEGTKPQRTAQYRAVKRGDVEYVIMNYEQVVNDWDIIRFLHFDAIVGDEIQAIKNAGSKRARHVKRLGHEAYRFGLTGQPIENRPEELYSIMQWIDPNVLGRADIFDSTFIVRGLYGSVKHYKNLRILSKHMSDVMHRRTRHDVRDELPAVVEPEPILIDFDPESARLYKIIVDELLELIVSTPSFSNFNVLNHYAGVDDDGNRGQIMARLMALRMLCDHPALLNYSAKNFDDPETKAGSQYASDLRASGLLRPMKSAPKMTATIEQINDLLEADPDNKIVVFSFFKPMLQLIADGLKMRPSQYVIFTGDLTPKERDEALLEFQKPGCRVFLSSDAGGVGIDLPQANYLISYDLPWSAGKFEQRQARIIRMSSAWPEVTLLNMLIRGSIEERMLEMLQSKSAIASAWLDGKGIDRSGQFTLTLGTLADFLTMKY